MSLVFLYGTLKAGFPNHRHLPPGAVFHAAASTAHPLPLVVGPHGIPFLLDRPGAAGALRVAGVLYRVTPPALAALDAFEGVGDGFYRRVAVDVVDAAGARATAEAYVRDPAGGGPPWARRWTVDRLGGLEFIPEYTEETAAASFVPRDARG